MVNAVVFSILFSRRVSKVELADGECIEDPAKQIKVTVEGTRHDQRVDHCEMD